MTESKIVIV